MHVYSTITLIKNKIIASFPIWNFLTTFQLIKNKQVFWVVVKLNQQFYDLPRNCSLHPTYVCTSLPTLLIWICRVREYQSQCVNIWANNRVRHMLGTHNACRRIPRNLAWFNARRTESGTIIERRNWNVIKC